MRKPSTKSIVKAAMANLKDISESIATNYNQVTVASRALGRASCLWKMVVGQTLVESGALKGLPLIIVPEECTSNPPNLRYRFMVVDVTIVNAIHTLSQRLLRATDLDIGVDYEVLLPGNFGFTLKTVIDEDIAREQGYDEPAIQALVLTVVPTHKATLSKAVAFAKKHGMVIDTSRLLTISADLHNTVDIIERLTNNKRKK